MRLVWEAIRPLLSSCRLDSRSLSGAATCSSLSCKTFGTTRGRPRGWGHETPCASFASRKRTRPFTTATSAQHRATDRRNCGGPQKKQSHLCGRKAVSFCDTNGQRRACEKASFSPMAPRSQLVPVLGASRIVAAGMARVLSP